MPIRLLKPTLRTSERWHRSSYFDRCLFISLINLADDYGRYEAHRKLLASECFPFGDEEGLPMTESKIDGGLRALASKDLLVVYEVEGKQYVQITRWNERVRSKSRFPQVSDGKVIWAANGGLTVKCQSSASQMTASPPSPTPTPTPTPSPVLANVSPDIRPKDNPEINPTELGGYEAHFRQRLCSLFSRPLEAHWSYAELTAMCEVLKRRDLEQELRILESYKERNPAYFPKSVGTLLDRWTDTLDQARNYTPPPVPGRQKSASDTAIDKVLADVERLKRKSEARA